jgi:hypothetical protein
MAQPTSSGREASRARTASQEATDVSDWLFEKQAEYDT